MATSTAIKSQGTTVGVSTNLTTPVYTTIGNVKSISGLGSGEASDIDITHLSSDAKEYTTGLIDNGTVSLTLDYDGSDAGQIVIQDAVEGSTTLKFKITLPDTLGAFTFNGIPKSFSKDISVDSVITSSVSIRVTGAVN